MAQVIKFIKKFLNYYKNLLYALGNLKWNKNILYYIYEKNNII